MAMFHSRTGSLVTLSNGNRTAIRNHPAQEFNNGVVLSAEPLKDNQIFEVKIDKKINSWSGSIEIGVTTSDPANLNFPTSATGFREGTWVMSGCSILKGGHSTIEEYGRDLDQLSENDTVGVMRTSAGVLHFFVNGADQGPAATGVPTRVYAVVDMYGKCAQVTTVDNNAHEVEDVVISNEITNEAIAEATFVHSNERLVFHERCGTLVRLTNNRRTAERIRPLDEFNNGVVMTNRPLKDDELFEIRLDRLVDKWSGSIEVGITTHNPSILEFPATMTNMRSGTIMMSGCGILTNGKGTRREYGEYNLDELTEGDRIGLMRKNNGTLHYYINGMDQGVAATATPQVVWGVVDLYGMAVKVTILDGNEAPYEMELVSHRANNFLRQFPADVEEEAGVETGTDANLEPVYSNNGADDNSEEPRLTFNVNCGTHAAVKPGHTVAHRPNAMDDFNNGVVLTARHLRPNEMFEVRLDKMVDKWAGSIEIGVTTHSPSELEFPSTMTNIRSGTWMMTGNGVMHNGTTVIDEYGQNLDRLKVGDRVGVMRTEDGTLHFYVNSIDQGAAASNVPGNVYGVIDLYGQAAQATIVDQSDPDCHGNTEEAIDQDSDELRFHSIHGKNATIIAGGKSAVRPNARGEFNDAIVISNRPLRHNELFEVTIEKMVDRWSGSIEAGVTAILPDDLEFPNTMTDIDYDTWMLSGSAIMQDGSTVRNGYKLDLDTLSVGSRIGMMHCSDGTLHFYLDGVDQGVACTDLTQDVYAVIDLYGQCAQVTITSGSNVRLPDNHLNSVAEAEHSVTSPFSAATEMTHRFSQCCGKNVVMKNNGCTACRERHFNYGLIFSSEPLRNDELFEVKIDSLNKKWAGSLHVGVTTMAISDSLPLSVVPASAADLKSKVTWVVTGSEVKRNGVTIKENYAPSLERLEVNNRLGVKRCADSTLHIYINGDDMGVAATNVPKNVFGLFDLYGMVDSVSVVSSVFAELYNCTHPTSLPSTDSSDSIEDEQDQDTAESSSFELHSNRGKNIQLSNGNLTATRVGSYNQGVVVSHKPLPRNKVFKVRIDKLSPRWTSSLTVGVIGFPPDKFTFPVTAISIKKSCWLIQGDCVFQSGVKIKEQYGPNLDSLPVGHTVGVMVDDQNQLHLVVDGNDQGVAARDIPHVCYVIADLYGLCEQLSLVSDEAQPETSPHITDYREKADIEDSLKEKSCRNQEPVPQRNCEYQNMCSRFRASLALPDGYFTPDYNRCFCDTCHKSRGDEPYLHRGEPPKDYALPFGWCKFALRIPPKAEMLGIFEKWHIAYHGTHVAVIRKVLDSGDILLPGDVSQGGYSLLPQAVNYDEKNKPDEQQDIKQILLSPTIRYSGSQTYAPKSEYRDSKSKKVYQARVAFQVCVKPGSYKIGPQSIGANEQFDPKFSNSEVEWATKERGSTILTSLLVKLE